MKILIREKLSDHIYKTPEGYLVCVDSVLARPGSQTYSRNELFQDGDDSEIEVDRPEEEVFSNETLASFENKPLTLTHPEEDVTPENYKEYAVGFSRDIKRGIDEGKPVMLGTIVVTDAEAIKGVESGKYKELSCGYDCDIDDSDHPCQRNIRGNHIALCEQGRAGNARIVDSVKDDYTTISFTGSKEAELIEELCQKYGCKIKTRGIDRYYIEGPFDAVKKVEREIGYYQFNGERMRDSINNRELKIFAQKILQVKNEKELSDVIFEISRLNKNLADKLRSINNGGIEYRKGKISDIIMLEINDSVQDVEPRAGEKKEDFIERFMSETKSEYPDIKQRYAVANSYWNRRDSVKDIDPYAEATGALEEDADKLEEKVKDGEKYIKTAKDKVGRKFMIFEKEDKSIIVRNESGMEKRFSNLKAVEEEFSRRGMTFEDSVNDSPLYVIYAKGTEEGYRALYAKKSGAPGYSNEASADKFDESEADRKLSAMKNGKYTWEKRKVKDANMKEYIIRWWDLINKQRGYSKDMWLYETPVKAESLKEALQKLADKYTFGVGTHNTMVIAVRGNGTSYNITGRLDELLRKDYRGYDSVKDSKLDKVVKIVKVLNKK